MFLRGGSGLDSGLIVRNLVSLISAKPDPYAMDFDLQPEIVLLSCRCLYNLIDVNVNAIGIIAQQNGVEALVEKLQEIEFIDLAEQILKVLEKISLEYPSAIIKSDALMASLQYLDFFGLHVQRTALTLVCNTCESLPGSGPSNSALGEIAFTKLRSIVDIVVNLLGYGDQRIVDLAATALSKIAAWVCKDPKKLPELFAVNHLSSILLGLQNSADYKQSSTNKMFLALGKTINHIMRESSDYGAHLVTDLKLLTLLRNIIADSSISDMVHAIHVFTSSRPTDQCIIVLDILAQVFPALPSKDIWSIQDAPAEAEEAMVHRQSMSLFQKEIVPLLSDVFIMSSDLTIRKKVVLCIAKVVWFSQETEELKGTLMGCKKFGKFVFELIHYHHTSVGENSKNLNDERALIYAGLAISKIVIEKCGVDLRDWLIREGVKAELNGLVEKIPPKDESDDFQLEGNEWMLLYEEESPTNGSAEASQSQQLVDGVPMQRVESRESKIEKIRKSLRKEAAHHKVLVGWTAERFSEASLLKRLFRVSEEVDKLLEDETETANLSVKVGRILELQAKIREIGTSTSESLYKDISAHLDELVGIIKIHDDQLGSGITNYELIQSDLIDFLIDFLTSKADGESHEFNNSGIVSSWKVGLQRRLEMFMSSFAMIEDESRGGFASLVAHLNEHLSRLEKLPILSSATSDFSMFYGNSALRFISQLTRQIRLQVTPRLGTDLPPQLQKLQISIPAVSSFQALIHYINTRWSNSNTAGDPESDEEESDIDIEDSEDSPVEERTILIAGSPEKVTSPLKRAERSSTHTKSNTRNIVVYFNDKPVAVGATVFATIYDSLPKPVDIGTAVWGKVHHVSVAIEEPPTTRTHLHGPKKTCLSCEGAVFSLVYSHMGIDQEESFGSEFSRPLVLITLLNALNERYQYLSATPYPQISPSAFLNNKIAAKVARQLSEPVITVSGMYPNWTWSILYNSGFLIPFETRLMFLRCTGFGNARNLLNWLQYHKTSSDATLNLNSIIRADRLKVKMGRKCIFESMSKVMALIGDKPSILEVEFVNEVGSGLGPTVEFFALVSSAIRNRRGVLASYGGHHVPIWRTDSSDCNDSDLLNPQLGLYPAPLQRGHKLEKYAFLT
jgi:E3 ubiquitin-protein ligase TRIP12